jgi:hypothetical protein
MTDPQLLMQEIFRENLCTYFILPLLKINKHTFASEHNFIESFLADDHKSIYVQVKTVQFFHHRMNTSPHFLAFWKDQNESFYCQYAIPEIWNDDVAFFLRGKYSRFSEDAKDMIKKYSLLHYEVRNNEGIIITDVRILALEKSKNFKELLEKTLGCTIDENQELLSIPSNKIYMNEVSLTPYIMTSQGDIDTENEFL